jgi:signal transduction histidine kinase
MPLWQIFHPVDAYTPEDRKTLSERITALYASGNVPKFYVVIAFHPLPADSMYVGGEPRSSFVRFKIDQMARTLPGEVLWAWWMRRIEEVIAPFVTQRGLESEVQIDELPAEPRDYLREKLVDECHTTQEERLKSLLLTSFAHELRTPLTSILFAFTRLREFRHDLDSLPGELIAVIENEALQLNRTRQPRLRSIDKGDQ